MALVAETPRNNRYAQDPRLRREIFKASVRCFNRFGLRRATMDDVAEEAGVSRKTVYNYFDNKSVLVAEFLYDEGRRLNARAAKQIDFDLPPAELLVEAEMASLTSSRKSPHVDMLCNPDAITVTAELVNHSERLAEIQREYWQPIFARLEQCGALVPGLDFAEAVTWITFIHFVLVANPATFRGDPAFTRRLLHRYLIPSILRPS
jgi:AcrR family transcriptional regulator